MFQILSVKPETKNELAATLRCTKLMTNIIPKQALEYKLLYQISWMSEGTIGETNNTLRNSEQACKPNPV
jgi:hypothetical protein